MVSTTCIRLEVNSMKQSDFLFLQLYISFTKTNILFNFKTLCVLKKYMLSACKHFFLKVKIYKCKFWVDELVHCIAFQHPLLANASDAAVCFVVETTLYISTHIFFTSSNFVIFYTSNRQQIFDMAPTLAYWDIRGVSVYYLFECPPPSMLQLHLIFVNNCFWKTYWLWSVKWMRNKFRFSHKAQFWGRVKTGL